MKVEQTFVMHETLKWINWKIEQRKNDKYFLKNFRQKETAIMIEEILDREGSLEEIHKEREQRFNDAI